MSGIYIHIPFCKQACHYCNFHFSTSLQAKDVMLEAIEKELVRRSDFFDPEEDVETIYWGGGTPSLLSGAEIESMIDVLHRNYRVSPKVEYTLEANPDDLTADKIRELKTAGIQRLSIGIQAFRDDLLQYMNRAHNEVEALKCLEMVFDAGFDSINADLIYGIPGLSDSNWEKSLLTMADFPIDHLSCYALTVEPKTALNHFITSGKSSAPDDEATARQFILAHDILSAKGFEHYEISNYARDGKRSKHNTAYWKGIPYLGIGPSAHSFRSGKRYWNVSNNAAYLKREQPEVEVLSLNDQFNEYIMTGMRTVEGIDKHLIRERFGSEFVEHLEHTMASGKQTGIVHKDDQITLSPEGWLFCDEISSNLFIV